MPASGSAVLDGATFDLHGGLGVIDWTRSRAKRETTWKWASFASHQRGQALGLNLSAEVYDDDRGASRENAMWVDGVVRPLGGVRFELPELGGRDSEPWHLIGDEVDLVFEPQGARSQRLDLRVIRSQFVQPFGAFHGKVAEHVIDGAFGVVEDHVSVW
jgi:hypothetical protein